MSWILRRLVQLVVVILVVTFFTALLSSLLPGDPCRTMLPTGRPSDIAQCRHDIGLDENLVVRYGKWAKGFFTGDMGRYYTIPGQQGDSIFDHVKSSLPTSLLIVFYVQLLTLLIAIPLGVLSAYKAGSLYDRGGTGMAFALVALPTFVLAALLKYWFGLRLGWFPTVGYTSIGDNVGKHLKSVAMPVITLTVAQIAIYSRLLRSDMVATLQEDFILMAKAKGMSNRRILWVHALRPSSLTLLTVAGLNIGALVSGSLIIERIFNINGIGFQLFDAVNRRQFTALQGYVAVVAVLYVVVNFFVDILYSVLDPRIRNV